MLMMFQQPVQVCQVMVIISFSSSVTSLASLLPPGEVAALSQIGKTLYEDGQLSLIFGDRCESEKVKIVSTPNEEMNYTIDCSCSIADDKFCHITSFMNSKIPNLDSVLKVNSTALRRASRLRSFRQASSGFGQPYLCPKNVGIFNEGYIGCFELDEKYFLYNNIVDYSDFTRNYLYGTIPVEWASMKNLSSISLTANRLSGNIPGYLGNFTALNYLSLESNQFSGVVPPELGKLARLDTLLRLIRCRELTIAGYFPAIIALMTILNGTVPEFIGSWTQLQYLGLCATGLQGPVPRAIFLLEKLNDLKISDTPGPEFPLPIVPYRMELLVLRNINLNGTIPEEAWSVEKRLFLSGNLLTGTVPESFIQNNQYL
ncbi:hypothetical protein DKX38_017317 [Salix brachista]|uniref:Malectin-like domain-containing protein n=1 Tax=Salix brachista TaxID=2182728 RepID=A0A5N5KVS2_9ROSI|nr:hypothetical protein DKX38_017317 [Salix brachista]